MPPETPLMPPAAEEKSKAPLIVVLLLVLVALALAGCYYFGFNQYTPPVENVVAPTAPVAESTLGEEIYNDAANPTVALPDTAPSVANPIDDAYKNPFE